MTRKEAIAELKRDIELDNDFTEDYLNAVNMAIEALEEVGCEDYINRKVALDDYVRTRDCFKAGHWIPVSERLPETDNKNSINSFNVLLWVKYKKHPEKKAQIYLGKLKRIDGDDGSGNFWGIKTETCEWTIWGWSYFYEPEVIAWMPLPEQYKEESEEK